MTLPAVPASKRPTVTTEGWAGSTSRETIVWIAMTIRLPTTTASTASCGRAAWPPWPRTEMRKPSVEAFTGPSAATIQPVGK